MRINHGQRLFRVLARQILLSIFQIGIGQVIVRVRRVRIREEVELENLNRCSYLHPGLAHLASLLLRLAFAHMVFAYDVDVNFRPQLHLGISLQGFHQLLLDARDSFGRPELIEDCRRCQGVRWRVPRRFDQRGYKPIHDDAGQLGMGLEQVSSVAAVGGNFAGMVSYHIQGASCAAE